MTDVATVADRPAMRPARERGALAIADRVVAKIAGRAATEVDDVDIRTAKGVGHLFGGNTLDVDAKVDGGTATVTVTVAVAYPSPVYDTAARVRRQVKARLVELAGLNQVEVRVEIAELAVGLGRTAGPRVV
jgi:uncharacterized alkaline shock family protein YloU